MADSKSKLPSSSPRVTAQRLAPPAERTVTPSSPAAPREAKTTPVPPATERDMPAIPEFTTSPRAAGVQAPLENRITQQMVAPASTTTTSGTARAKAVAESVLAEEDPTTASDKRDAKFAPDEQMRTALVPAVRQRDRLLTPPAPTHPYQPAITEAAVEVRVGTPDVAQRTPIWVSTHKPSDEPDERLILVRQPDSARAASFRVIRHRLMERGDPRVIAVTSASEGEGKTTCAANLALALGECGRAKVLLVEANLRTPALAGLFGFMPPECFSTQLSRHKDKPLEPWSVVEIYSPSLHVLAVKPESESRPLLDGPAFSLAIELLRHAGYDYIVIDTPPVLGAADVNLVEDAADGVLFTARSRATSGRRLTQAVEQLAPAKLLGLALLDA
jgi:Mrp family chromosome partitioning ATPase